MTLLFPMITLNTAIFFIKTTFEKEVWGNLYVEEIDKCLQPYFQGERLDPTISGYRVKAGIIGDCNTESMFKLASNCPDGGYGNLYNRNGDVYVMEYEKNIDNNVRVLARKYKNNTFLENYTHCYSGLSIFDLGNDDVLLKGEDGKVLVYDPPTDNVHYKISISNNKYAVRFIPADKNFIVTRTVTETTFQPQTTANHERRINPTITHTIPTFTKILPFLKRLTLNEDIYNEIYLTKTETKTKHVNSTLHYFIYKTNTLLKTTTTTKPVYVHRNIYKTVTSACNQEICSPEYIVENFGISTGKEICKLFEKYYKKANVVNKDVMISELAV